MELPVGKPQTRTSCDHVRIEIASAGDSDQIATFKIYLPDTQAEKVQDLENKDPQAHVEKLLFPRHMEKNF